MEDNFYVYALLDPRKKVGCRIEGITYSNQVFYIGKGRGTRMYQHTSCFLKENPCSIKVKILKKIFALELKPICIKIKQNITEDEAFVLEKKLIKKFGRIDKRTGILSNMTDGGDGVSGYRFSSKQKKKLSEIKSGSNNPNYGKSENLKGENNPFRKGITETEYQKRLDNYRRGDNNPMRGKGYLLLGEKNGRFGKPFTHTKESKEKMSLSRTGSKNHFYGRSDLLGGFNHLTHGDRFRKLYNFITKIKNSKVLILYSKPSIEKSVQKKLCYDSRSNLLRAIKNLISKTGISYRLEKKLSGHKIMEVTIINENRLTNYSEFQRRKI